MKVESFEPSKHYKKVCEWWDGWKFPPVPLDHLPQTGFVISNDKATPLCAGFLYITDSKFAVVEFIVGDPLANREERRDSVKLLLDSLAASAETFGVKTIHSSCHASNSRLTEHYEASGFSKVDSNMLHFIKRTDA